MHVVATNICVWIRTLVLEYLKEITVYHRRFNDTYEDGILAGTLLFVVVLLCVKCTCSVLQRAFA